MNLKDIWTTLIEEKESQRAAAVALAQTGVVDESNREATIIYVGARGSGKSTLRNAYMYKDRSDVPKPTTCLDYKYTRTYLKDQMSEDKSVSHFWELGGGRSLVNLLEVPLSESTLRDALVVITLDLSKPVRCLDDAVYWLSLIKKRCDGLVANLRTKNRNAADALIAAARRRFGENHPDIGRTELIPIPVLICAHKYDTVLKTLEPESLRILSRGLRAAAHTYGASLMYTSIAHRDTLLKAYRSRIGEHPNGREGKKPSQPSFDHTQHISVQGGQDNWQQIGEPPGGAGGKNPLAAWSSAFTRSFEPVTIDPIEDGQLDALQLEPEKSIDASLAQREEDLKRLHRELDLRRKLNAKETEGETMPSSNIPTRVR